MNVLHDTKACFHVYQHLSFFSVLLLKLGESKDKSPQTTSSVCVSAPPRNAICDRNSQRSLVTYRLVWSSKDLSGDLRTNQSDWSGHLKTCLVTYGPTSLTGLVI